MNTKNEMDVDEDQGSQQANATDFLPEEGKDKERDESLEESNEDEEAEECGEDEMEEQSESSERNL